MSLVNMLRYYMYIRRSARQLVQFFTPTNTSVTILVLNHYHMINAYCNSHCLKGQSALDIFSDLIVKKARLELGDELVEHPAGQRFLLPIA